MDFGFYISTGLFCLLAYSIAMFIPMIVDLLMVFKFKKSVPFIENSLDEIDEASKKGFAELRILKKEEQRLFAEWEKELKEK